MMIRSSRNFVALGLFSAVTGTSSAWEPGTYPVAPARMASTNLSVDTKDRNDVVAFWHAVYQASEGYEKRIKWTGNYLGNEGTTAAPFVEDVQRRLNYFRAMCGVPANAKVNTDSTVFLGVADLYKAPQTTLKSVAAQKAALMLVRNFNAATGTNPANSHNPPSTAIGWSTASWNAQAYGNISFGLYGPGAITEYMIEGFTNGGGWNTEVGHRRWCIYSRGVDYASGDQPGISATQPPTNILYVMQKPTEIGKSVTPAFITYPPAGFCPARFATPFWSITAPGVDFSKATVTMTTSDGTPVTVKNVKKSNGFGDNALVWEVTGAITAQSVTTDKKYLVKVAGISSTTLPATFNYSVTFINPDRLTSNQALTGSASPKKGVSTTYSFTRPSGAESVQVACLRLGASTWTEDAETGTTSKIIDDTAENYKLVSTATEFPDFPGFGPITGKKSFHLTFPITYDLISRGVPDQSFELDRDIVAKTGAKLKFNYRRGYMSTSSSFVAEISSDDGATWTKIGKTITGLSDIYYDEAPSAANMSIPASSTPIRIRFRYFMAKAGGVYTKTDQPTAPTGIFIDDITTSNCSLLTLKNVESLSKSAKSFAFKNSTAGATLDKDEKWYLRLQTVLGGKTFRGPAKIVTIAP